MFKEHERIVLTSDLPDEGLVAGDVGSIVHIYTNGEAFEVEFFGLDGYTAAVATITQSQMRPITNRDITHARQMPTTA